jgi:Flp pilus assembly pilin Flp
MGPLLVFDPLQVVQEVEDMNQMVARIRRLLRSDEGQDLIEYGLLVALIAFVAVAGVTAVGNTIFTVFWQSIGQAV